MGTWENLNIDGHACEVFLPEEPSPFGDTLIYLHDVHLKGLRGRAAFEGAFSQFGLRVLAPFTGHSWWSDKLCTEFDQNRTAESYLIDCIVPWIATHGEAQPAQIGLLGIGMGGQGGLRLSFKYPDLFPHVAAITPAIDYQECWNNENYLLAQMYANPEAVRQDTATLHIHPLYWPRNIWFCSDPLDLIWSESAQRLSMKLSALGIPYQADLEMKPKKTDEDYEEQMALPAVEFLVERLEQARRTVR